VDGYINRWFLDPLVGRGYPQDMVNAYGDEMAFVQPGDMETLSVPLDFIGINYYHRSVVRSEKVSEAENAPRTVFSGDVTEMGWEVHPESLYKMLGRLYFDYDFPVIHITENGAAYVDEVSADGEVHDPKRVSYYARHLQQVHRAVEAGIPVKGYFAWSLMDNFEWAYGYSKRFGLVYVDYQTQQRIMKDSAKWYAYVIQNNAVE